jgi:CoA:oxalate CoA-transferase
MVDGLFAVLENAVVRHTISGEIPSPLGSRHPSITPFQSFKTKDSWIIAAIGNDILWARFCKVIDREDLTGYPRFKTNPLRTKHVKELISIISEEISKKTTKEWSELFEKADLPYSPVNSIKEICEDPHIRYRNMLVEIDQPEVGKMTITGSPINLSETPGEVYAPAPLLGQHTEEILRNVLSYSEVDIDDLKREGIINKQS